MIRRADALARLNPTFSSLILEFYLQNKNLSTICSIRIITLVMYTINIHGQLHCYDRLLCSRDSRPNRSISCWSFVGCSETGLSRIALWDSFRGWNLNQLPALTLHAQSISLFKLTSRSLFALKSLKSTYSPGLARWDLQLLLITAKSPFSHNNGGFSTGYLFSEWLPWIISKPTKRILHGFVFLLPVLIFILELSCGWLGVFQRCFYIFCAHGLNF